MKFEDIIGLDFFAPNKKSWWINEDDGFRCSNCGVIANKKYKHCPICISAMTNEGDNNE